MIIYNVTVNIEDSVHDEWLKWMKAEHVPAVMKTGYFMENRICRVLVNEESGKTYSIQYTCRNLKDYETYRDTEAPRLQREHSLRFKEKFVAFRTLLEIV